MSFALVIEPDSANAAEVTNHLANLRLECTVAQSGEEGWQKLAERRPDVVLAELSSPQIDGFFRRLRDEYMGTRPPLVGVAEPDKLVPELHNFDLDAVILKPVYPTTLSAILRPTKAGNVVKLSAARMRELLRLSCLGTELQVGLDAVASRLVLVYGVQNCVVLATASERQWVGCIGDHIPPERWPALWETCDQAVNAGAPLLIHKGDGGIETRFAAAIRAPNGAIVGAICLWADGPTLFSPDAREALIDLAHRFGQEISWRSVHDRVSQERDRMRDNTMRDPMLGILSRAALDHTVSTEQSRAERNKAPLSVAVLDIRGLRHINDRHGHVIGDAALKHVADLARQHIRGQDVVARFGGDEMGIVLPGTQLRGATASLRRLRQAVESSPLQVGDETIAVDVVIGAAEFRPEEDDAQRLLSRAHAASIAARQQDVGVYSGSNDDSPDDDTHAGDSMDRFVAGTTLAGMYQIAHEISRGAMGVVYRAEDLGLSRPVAIKMLRPDLVNDRDLVDRFRAEAGVLAALDHDNLVRVYAFVEAKDDVFFVMELVEGVSLDDVISDSLDEGAYLTGERVCEIIKQVAAALDAMHDAGLMHRDVKPGNVVLDRARNRAVLIDVGLAKRMGDRAKPAGTPGFIAPESFRGGPESPSSDVYGLAATAYSLLTGRAPFGRADDYKEILKRQIGEQPPDLSSFRDDLSDEINKVVLGGMTVDAVRRPATAGEFAAALEASLGSAQRRTPTMRPPSVERSRKRPLTTRPLEDRPRTLTLNLEMLPPGDDQPAPMTRGVVFRGAVRLLGDRGTAQLVSGLSQAQRGLGDALTMRTSPLSWLDSQLFMQLLEVIDASDRDANSFAKELAASVVESSFDRFYPSSPDSLSPKSTLSAADILWRRYHTWGKLTVVRAASRSAIFHFEGPERPGIYAFIEGWLESIAARAGGKNPRVKHSEDKAEFQVYWGA